MPMPWCIIQTTSFPTMPDRNSKKYRIFRPKCDFCWYRNQNMCQSTYSTWQGLQQSLSKLMIASGILQIPFLKPQARAMGPAVASPVKTSSVQVSHQNNEDLTRNGRFEDSFVPTLCGMGLPQQLPRDGQIHVQTMGRLHEASAESPDITSNKGTTEIIPPLPLEAETIGSPPIVSRPRWLGSGGVT